LILIPSGLILSNKEEYLAEPVYITPSYHKPLELHSGDSGKKVLEDISEVIYTNGEYADYSYFNGYLIFIKIYIKMDFIRNNIEFSPGYLNEEYDYDSSYGERGDIELQKEKYVPKASFLTDLTLLVVIG